MTPTGVFKQVPPRLQKKTKSNGTVVGQSLQQHVDTCSAHRFDVNQMSAQSDRPFWYAMTDKTYMGHGDIGHGTQAMDPGRETNGQRPWALSHMGHTGHTATGPHTSHTCMRLANML